jgi:hypothetical protein
MARRRPERSPDDVIDSLRRLRDDADDVLQRTRTLLGELDERLDEARRVANVPRRQKPQKVRKAG